MASTVTVASKLPHGLILRAFEMREQFVNDKLDRRAEQLGASFTIRGNAVAFGKVLTDEAGGFALTHGVPADLWDKWLEQNRDSDMVKNGLIFAHARAGHATGEAKEKQELRTGLEPLNPAGDARSWRRPHPSLSTVGTADVRDQ